MIINLVINIGSYDASLIHMYRLLSSCMCHFLILYCMSVYMLSTTFVIIIIINELYNADKTERSMGRQYPWPCTHMHTQIYYNTLIGYVYT